MKNMAHVDKTKIWTDLLDPPILSIWILFIRDL